MFDAHFALLLFPGIGLAVLGLSLVGLFQMVHGICGLILSLVAVLLVLVGAVAVVWGLLNFSIPAPLYPKWARDAN
ncbi:hypothetical protein HMPREF3198_00440 [Winkia neuii]|nr:hypothetical protein HMPREF3198_00440 [Winkia neuii]